jgi:peptidoglycan/LPS O-acetylase OafA/YrhL
VISIGYLGARWIGLMRGSDGGGESDVIHALMLSWWRPIFWALPTALVLVVTPHVFTEFRNSFLPDPERLVYYTIFFVGGAILHRYRWEYRQLIWLYRPYLIASIVAVGVVAAMLKQVGWTSESERLHSAAFAAFAALASWLSIFGLLGLALDKFSGRSALVRYASDASVWVYLFHLPVVGIAQIMLLGVEIPAIVKFAIVSAAALSVSLVTYQLFVRHSFVGRILHGAREPIRPYALAPVPD